MTSTLQHPTAGAYEHSRAQSPRRLDVLSDVRGPTLALVCEACGRRGRYNVQRLMAEHGDAELADFL
jgi:hypothetical protein